MDNTTTDRRVRRTDKLLTGALLELLREMPMGKVTATELCRRADINRNTFYTRYSCPENLLRRLEDELYAEIATAISELYDSVTSLAVICDVIKAHKDISAALLSHNADPAFMERIFTLATKRELDKMSVEENSLTATQRRMVSLFTIEGSAAVMREWANGGFTEDSKDVAGLIYALCLNGTRAVIKDKPARR